MLFPRVSKRVRKHATAPYRAHAFRPVKNFVPLRESRR
jgi:hypothetical protein